jgi:hypothetical protein
MAKNPQKSRQSSQRNSKNSLARGLDDQLAFRRYTQQVWSKVARRPISEDEADEIIENFGRFLRALASENGEK